MDTHTKMFAPEDCHEALLQAAPRLLRFRSQSGPEYDSWQGAVRAKLREIVGTEPEPVALDIRRQPAQETPEFVEIRFTFDSESCATVPCHLLLPRAAPRPVPVVICLQGHTSGMHISLGRTRFSSDEAMISGGDRDFALQAVRQGYAALVMEQRCFGERGDQRPPERHTFQNGCHHASMVSLLLGRTMIGERVWDVSRAIDALETFPEVDEKRIGCMGNSGGGTISWFAACLDERIRAVMPSCYVCSFLQSIARIDHCADNYLPGFLRWFDLPDLACLIAPRPLVIVAGQSDPLFPIDGVHSAFATIESIYRAGGAPDTYRLIVGENGHRFYAGRSWPIFASLFPPS